MSTVKDGNPNRRPIGRPTKYRASYCEDLINHMEQGYSYESFGGKIGVAVSQLYKWEEAHPEFQEAKGVGVAKAQIWWETMGQIAVTSGRIKDPSGEKDDNGKPKTIAQSFSPTVWRMTMMNRFGYREKKTITDDQGKPLSLINVDSAREAAKIFLEMTDGQDEDSDI